MSKCENFASVKEMHFSKYYIRVEAHHIKINIGIGKLNFHEIYPYFVKSIYRFFISSNGMEIKEIYSHALLAEIS